MFSRFFGKKRTDTPLRVRIDEPIDARFAAFLRPDPDDLPTTEGLVAEAWSFFEKLEEPLGPALVRWIESGLLRPISLSLEDAPRPPIEMLENFGLGAEEKSRIERATHIEVFSSPDLLMPPAFGLWASMGAALAAARRWNGVVLDPHLPRVLPLDSDTGSEVPPDGKIRMPHHLRVLTSTDERGLAWITTKGMSKFGLPELEIQDVPTDIAQSLWPLVNAMAALLRQLAITTATEDAKGKKVFEFGPELRIDCRQINEAMGDQPVEPAEGVRGWTTVRLEFRGGRRGSDDFLRIVPPSYFREGQGVWLHSALSDLHGVERTLVSVAADDEAMAKAHEQAVATLPDARKRFQAGLEPGERLFVKHGFPRDEQGLHEFMWVIVNTWTGQRIHGQLANDPQFRIDLRAGQQIDLSDSDVFDWLLIKADGSNEGGFTVSVGGSGEDEDDND